MCYSGRCEFEDHIGDCRLKSHEYKEYSKWAIDNGFEYCGVGLSPDEQDEREEWINNNKEKYEYFKKNFRW